MDCKITIQPSGSVLTAACGSNLLSVLRQAGLAPDAPCGGRGTCGNCRVLLDGTEVLACRTFLERDGTVTLPQTATAVLTDGFSATHFINPVQEGYLLGFDIGTTTLAGVLLDKTNGSRLAAEGRANPQIAFGGDVITRIRHALSGQQTVLTDALRYALTDMTQSLCRTAGIDPKQIGTVSVVGNPTMQQLFLGLSVENLAQPPFAPVLTQARAVDAAPYLPVCQNALLLIVPDLAGFVGADTVACILASKLSDQAPITLLVDIGTNGEIVLGNRDRMVACAAAAGPALEGANIRFGMRGQTGAIDRVQPDGNRLVCRVIGGGTAQGICGSGLLDAVAAALELGWINSRGKILTTDSLIHLTDGIFLNQEDIRQVQLAKGAIAAGIELLAAQLGITPAQIDRVYLAGAFGSFLNPNAACRIGLLPAALQNRIQPIGNAALSGAAQLACDRQSLTAAQKLTEQVGFVELAALPEFPKRFAINMRF